MYSLFDLIEGMREQFQELIDVLGPDNIFLSLILIGLFFLFTKVLVKWKLFQDEFDEPNTSAAGVVAFILSFTITWLVNSSGAVSSLHAGDIFDYLGYSSGPGSTIIPLFVLGVFIYIIFKVGPWFLIVGGGSLFLASFTDLIYSQEVGIATGFGLAVIGGLWLWRRKKKKREKELGGNRGEFPRAKKDWGKIMPIILVVALIVFIVLLPFSSFGSTWVLIIIAIIVILILVKVIFSRRKKIVSPIKQGWNWTKRKAQEKKRVWDENQEIYKDKERRKLLEEERKRTYLEKVKSEENRKRKLDEKRKEEYKGRLLSEQNELRKKLNGIDSELSRLVHYPDGPSYKKLKKEREKILNKLKRLR